MKKISIIFSFLFLGFFSVNAQTTSSVDSTTLMQWAQQNEDVFDYIEANHPSWLELTLSRDTIDFRANKVVIGNDKEWIIKPSRLTMDGVRLNYRKFYYDIERYARNDTTELVLFVKPK